MNFQSLNKIEKPQFYMDLAITKAMKESDQKFSNKSVKQLIPITRDKIAAEAKIGGVAKHLKKNMDSIIKEFPNFDELDIFYKSLIKATLDYPEMKKSLGAINWAGKKIEELSKIYLSKLNRSKDKRFIKSLSSEFYGRVSSVLKQIKSNLEYLEVCRRVMTEYPAVKPKLFTVAIAGFPNVGKSTLLKKFTDSDVEIKNYAFTTKKLCLGYKKFGYQKVQFIDTPGTLNRKKMNIIEMQAELALDLVAGLIIYVFDPTFQYPLADQQKLLANIKKLKKKTLIYVSKTDIAKQECIDEVLDKNKTAITDYNVLVEKVSKQIVREEL